MRLTAALLLAGCLAACSGDGSCPQLPGVGRYCLAPGPWPEFAAEQATRVSFRGETLTLIARIESGPSGLQFAGVSPLGQTLLQVSWENGALRGRLPPALEGRLDAALFPALLQIATWPAERVREGLDPALTLSEEEGRRVIRNGRHDLLTVSWEGNALPYRRLRFDAPAAGLSIDARTLEDAAP